MKLSKTHKAEFVRAVLADVPTKNYPTQAEDLARKLCQAKYKELGIDKVDINRLTYVGIYIHVWRDDSTDTTVATLPSKALRGYYTCNSFAQINGNGLLDHEIAEITDCPEMMAIRQGYANEFNMLNKLRKQLTAVIASCTTLKQAKEALPEFVKYLPEEPGSAIDRTLPVVGNLVADLSKAGWPKKDSKRK
jgi:hypothetical protein